MPRTKPPARRSKKKPLTKRARTETPRRAFTTSPLTTGTRVRLVQDHPLIGVAGDEGAVISGPDSQDRYAVDIDTPEIKPRLFGVPRARLAAV